MADREDIAARSATDDIGMECEGESVEAGVDRTSGAGSEPPRTSVWLPVVVPLTARDPADDGPLIDEWPAPVRLTARNRRKPRWMRWLGGRAAMIAIAASIGALAGGAAATGVGYMLAARDDDGAAAEEVVAALRSSIGQLAFEIKSLKEGVGESGRAASAGLAALGDRLESAETAQDQLAEKIGSLSENLARKATAEAAVSPETTASITRSKPPVARDWVLWRVQNGRALVQGDDGYFEVAPGSTLPGLGLVQRIVKQNGRWVVLTRNGMIVSRG